MSELKMILYEFMDSLKYVDENRNDAVNAMFE